MKKLALKLNVQKTKIMASGPITSWQIDKETMQTVTNFIFLSSKITVDSDYSHEIKKRLLLGRKAMKKPRQWIKKQRHHFADKGLYCQSYGLSSNHGRMCELDRKEGCHFSSIAQSCPTLCDPMYCSRPGFPVHHYLKELMLLNCGVGEDS